MDMLTLIGPIYQLLSLQGLPGKGPLQDEELNPLSQQGILIKNGIISEVGDYTSLVKKTTGTPLQHTPLSGRFVALPGFIDPHTHICYAGSRAADFAFRNTGKSYLEIADAGGGIWSTVKRTREADIPSLAALTAARADYLLQQGVTTIEVKSGYGLSVAEELKMLRAIALAQPATPASLIPTCLAAHTIPKDTGPNRSSYIDAITHELLPTVQREGLSNRVDAFIERSAFTSEELAGYFNMAKNLGMQVTVHADQFTTGGSAVAIDVGAISADHLEASSDKEIGALAGSAVIPVALPGASMGLGMNFAPARKLLDAGCSLAIASDFNPGSAPMGQLLTQASVLATYEKLSNAEVLAAITCRAANALALTDAGVLRPGAIADILLFDTDDYREITYQQGRMLPAQVWKKGILIQSSNKNL